ncbi:MAG: transposase [bacterium]|nr:transposase [bacterium]
MEVRRAYKYGLYRCDKRDKHLREQIRIAGVVWNHALALQKRYYHLTTKYIPLDRMKAHVARLRMRTQHYAFWKAVGSQAVQDVLERLDTGYQRFFKRLAKRPPRYKKFRQRFSFTLKQAGWKLLDGSKVQIGKYRYRFVAHRPLRGTVKMLTVKRDAADRLWLIFSVVETVPDPIAPTLSHVAGFDFGLKTFLTDHTGQQYTAGLHHLHALKRLKKMQSRKDRKPHGTHNRRHAAKRIARMHIRIADRRRDEHYKLAHALCKTYDLLCFETLNLTAMKSLWGRKVSDLAFRQLMTILKQVADKRNKIVRQIGRFERTTGKCSACGHQQSLTLRQRVFQCQRCGLTLDRDHNAAINILNAGASAQRPVDALRPLLAGAASPDGRSPSR